jgi:paired amphipathic helix protein Sin3a
MNNPSLHGGGAFERDREIEEQQHRAAAEAMAHRDREQGDRQHREGYQPGAPHHSSAGSLPIHQPVASRIPGAIHSPGGLLANHGSSAPSIPLGAPSGPAASFGPPLHPEPTRPIQHSSQNNAGSQHQMFAPLPHTTVPPSNSLNASNLPPGIFGGPLPVESARTSQQPALFPSNTSTNHAVPGGPAGGLAHGQQPILNVSE